jgi:hypothetical protein
MCFDVGIYVYLGDLMTLPARLALFLDTLGMHPDFLIWSAPSDLADEPPF